MDELSNLMADIRRVYAMPASFEKGQKKARALAIRDRVEAGKTVEKKLIIQSLLGGYL